MMEIDFVEKNIGSRIVLDFLLEALHGAEFFEPMLVDNRWVYTRQGAALVEASDILEVDDVWSAEIITPSLSRPTTILSLVNNYWYFIDRDTVTSGDLYRCPVGGSSWSKVTSQYLYPGGVQRFSGFPDSPFPQSIYKAQIIIQASSWFQGDYPIYRLCVSNYTGVNPYLVSETSLGGGIWARATTYVYALVGGVWTYYLTVPTGQYIWLRGPRIDDPQPTIENYIIATNARLYWGSPLVTKYKTTSLADDNLPESRQSFFYFRVFDSGRNTIIAETSNYLWEWDGGIYWNRYQKDVGAWGLLDHLVEFEGDYYRLENGVLKRFSSPNAGQIVYEDVYSPISTLFSVIDGYGLCGVMQFPYYEGELFLEPPLDFDSTKIVWKTTLYSHLENETPTVLGSTYSIPNFINAGGHHKPALFKWESVFYILLNSSALFSFDFTEDPVPLSAIPLSFVDEFSYSMIAVPHTDLGTILLGESTIDEVQYEGVFTLSLLPKIPTKNKLRVSI